MANREALRDLQSRLAARLQAARTEVKAPGWLAVECGGLGFLLPLAQAGEIFPMTRLRSVTRTQPWFAGVANLRGTLVGVVDLAAFLGIAREPLPAPGSRGSGQLVSLNASLGVTCALWVDRLAGLRDRTQLNLVPALPISKPGFARDRWCDADGRHWQELDLSALAADPGFLSVAS